MPFSLAAAASTLSSPVPARTTTLSVVVARKTSPVTLVPPRTSSACAPSSSLTRSAPWTPTRSITSWPAWRMRSSALGSALSVTRTFTRRPRARARSRSRARPSLVGGLGAALRRTSERGHAFLERADHGEHVAQVVGAHVADTEDLALELVLSARHDDAVDVAQALDHRRRVDALGRHQRGHGMRCRMREQAEPQRLGAG